MWYLHKMDFSHKKEWNNAIYSNMDGPRDYQIKWSKSDRQKQISYDFIYIWNLKNDTNEHIYKTDLWRKTQIYDYQRGSGGGGEKLGVWDYIYTAIYTIGSTV